MAKRIEGSPSWREHMRPEIVDVYSVNDCVNDDFADYVDFWKHNGWWFFDSPELIQSIARESSIDLQGTKLFYYEAHELELADNVWRIFSPDPALQLKPHVIVPAIKHLEGSDVVVIWAENSPAPEHSPLSCQGLANELHANSHCLFDTFDEAHTALNNGKFDGCEPGALRLFAVYSVEWQLTNLSTAQASVE